ncbi:uncharacterized protein SCHCODRAFT_02368668 [Schizophyllum commune H4-8]|uniref:uncharacterized protein n=1 Tax=Schizophyllum commune (strain H4-8 / FGSC 9210) TaxID=578458 RepID=UPI00215DFC4C|nr:uncharacterized protein SCHCODRAFT_02368668 [Schizophyllum commune H4-8]KAI5889478.1 hypothetical protein SCHCODRAFT_02368668 [Schizophyllum commune H4-8]
MPDVTQSKTRSAELSVNYHRPRAQILQILSLRQVGVYGYPNVGLCHCRTLSERCQTWSQPLWPPRPRRSRLQACSISSEPSAACALGRDIWYVLTVASRGLSSISGSRAHYNFDGPNGPPTRWRHHITNGRRMGLTWRRRRYSRTSPQLSPPDYLRTFVQALGPLTSTCSVTALACRHSGGRG